VSGAWLRDASVGPARKEVREMQAEPLDESVKVRADFQGGTITPALFRRGEARLAVRAVNARWHDVRGRSRLCYFLVTADSGEVYQLCFDSGDLTWRLEFVLVEG
jgi:hypothetical protein